jgi:hypothetical protein
MLTVRSGECRYAQCRYAECRYAKCRSAQIPGANRGAKPAILRLRIECSIH